MTFLADAVEGTEIAVLNRLLAGGPHTPRNAFGKLTAVQNRRSRRSNIAQKSLDPGL
jgi:hypothetical protein